ncbi:MAG: hypothetical protein ACKO5Q_22605 [Microcystaceae cyanobacterium]
MAKSPQRSPAMPMTDPRDLNAPTLTTRYIQPFGVYGCWRFPICVPWK